MNAPCDGAEPAAALASDHCRVEIYLVSKVVTPSQSAGGGS
jgi:hypothetical protein